MHPDCYKKLWKTELDIGSNGRMELLRAISSDWTWPETLSIEQHFGEIAYHLLYQCHDCLSWHGSPYWTHSYVPRNSIACSLCVYVLLILSKDYWSSPFVEGTYLRLDQEHLLSMSRFRVVFHSRFLLLCGNAHGEMFLISGDFDLMSIPWIYRKIHHLRCASACYLFK
jgi:uncharacterized CHY-type Zn-finger protein